MNSKVREFYYQTSCIFFFMAVSSRINNGIKNFFLCKPHYKMRGGGTYLYLFQRFRFMGDFFNLTTSPMIGMGNQRFYFPITSGKTLKWLRNNRSLSKNLLSTFNRLFYANKLIPKIFKTK